MTVKAYAKLNLILNVLGKREDGYHEIETVFQAIDLYDRVTVEPAGHCAKDSAGFLSSGRFVPEMAAEDNLAMKALKEAKKAFGREDEFCRISIEKNIPLAGGLAGGSADAAAVLTALSKIWDVPWEEMMPIASVLGSDVPFCLASQNGHPCAVGRGRGELLEYIEPIKGRVALKQSDFSVKDKTAAVYKALIPADYMVKYDIASFMAAKTLEEKIRYMGNHLQPALERLSGKKEDMILCGAGPTYFKFDETGEYETII